MSDYRPIDCDRHSRFELAIIRRRRLVVAWREPGGTDHVETLHPTDLETAAGEEFLIAARDDDGAKRRIRLDRIREARDPDTDERL